jgi:hypothetical protein
VYSLFVARERNGERDMEREEREGERSPESLE